MAEQRGRERLPGGARIQLDRPVGRRAGERSRGTAGRQQQGNEEALHEPAPTRGPGRATHAPEARSSPSSRHAALHPGLVTWAAAAALMPIAAIIDAANTNGFIYSSFNLKMFVFSF